MDEGLTTGPAVIGNTVYVTSTLGNTTYALTADTGNLIWSFQTNGNIYSSPAVADGVVYFGDYDGIFYAIGGNSGGNTNEGIPNVTYYIIAVVVLLVIIAVAVIILRRKH